MIRYILQRISYFLLALILGLSIVSLTAGGCIVGLFQNELFFETEIEKNETALIALVDNASADAAEKAGLPSDAFKGAVSEKNFTIISTPLARNFKYNYNTDFSDSTGLLDAFVSQLGAYANNYSLELTGDEINGYAALAVDYVSEALSGSDTKNVFPIHLSQSSGIMYATVSSVILIIATVVALELLNRGRHRKYNYIGMGIMTGGYILIIMPQAIKLTDFLNQYRYCVLDEYNAIVRGCTEMLLNVCTFIGIIVTVAGLVMLLINYSYYIKKAQKVKLAKKMEERIKGDYMNEIPQQRIQRDKQGEFEKDVMKIDFDE